MDTFAERLQKLINLVHPIDRGPYSQIEIVNMVKEQGGSLSSGYLSLLLSGQRPSPSWTTLRDICRVFKVPMDYFNDDEVYEEVSQFLENARSVLDAEGDTVRARTYFWRRHTGPAEKNN